MKTLRRLLQRYAVCDSETGGDATPFTTKRRAVECARVMGAPAVVLRRQNKVATSVYYAYPKPGAEPQPGFVYGWM